MIDLNITGLDQLTRTLDEAQKAFAELDGELGTVSFDPNDPVSIEAAIQQASEMVDAKMGAYADNDIVGPMIEQVKENFRQSIIEQASGARLEGKNNDSKQD